MRGGKVPEKQNLVGEVWAHAGGGKNWFGISFRVFLRMACRSSKNQKFFAVSPESEPRNSSPPTLPPPLVCAFCWFISSFLAGGMAKHSRGEPLTLWKNPPPIPKGTTKRHWRKILPSPGRIYQFGHQSEAKEGGGYLFPGK